MQGLADATGIDLQKIINIHQIGELTQGQCSMYGAWDAATPDGGLMQLRCGPVGQWGSVEVVDELKCTSLPARSTGTLMLVSKMRRKSPSTTSTTPATATPLPTLAGA
jgi:hypothetical protein